MEKTKITNNVFIPMPVVLVGANVDGKANFMAVGWVSRVNLNPPMIAVGINKAHYTHHGILENKTFSVCVPDCSMVQKTDYCGVKSGKTVDKSKVFQVFYGETKTAPMAQECPLCMECNLVQTLDLPSNTLFLGEIVGAYADEKCLTSGKPDTKKIDPFLLSMPHNHYFSIGNDIAQAWNIGLEIKP